MIRKLLIANRGEIACRIARTARAMAIRTVAVHSDADRDGLHIGAADEAVRIGPAEATHSYLDIAAIIDAACASGADAIHPGYGFLSENADFARACEAAGLIFVGPGSATIEAMGDKGRAKRIAAEAGVAVAPGYDGEEQSDTALAQAAGRGGYPLMVKAAAGGGGRGMRRVRSSDELAAALDSARREARAAFGDDRLILERLIEDARHIEVQIFGDGRGNVVHLGERDCSAQRRHQKIVEETPSPFVDAALRARLTADAVKLARSVNYRGAGTVEFIVGGDGRHHFLEMNTRLQVEHPVTEMVTGIDLVEWQLRVAAGEGLPLAQDAVSFSGHAIEARITAEDVPAGFLPKTGRLARIVWPQGPHIRIDTGVAEGDAVSGHYDSMLAKLIAHGADRADAVARLSAALRELHIAGVVTNVGFLRSLVASDAFRDGNVTTDMIDGWVADGADVLSVDAPGAPLLAAAAAIVGDAFGGDWFRSTGIARCPVDLVSGGEPFGAVLLFEKGHLRAVEVNDQPVELRDAAMSGDRLVVDAGHGRLDLWQHRAGGLLWIDDGTHIRSFAEPDRLAPVAGAAGSGGIVAPLAGLVRQIFVQVGDDVEAGAPLVAIEAMKMETVLAARAAGRVVGVHAIAGTSVRAGQVLVDMEADADG